MIGTVGVSVKGFFIHENIAMEYSLPDIKEGQNNVLVERENATTSTKTKKKRSPVIKHKRALIIYI